MAEEKIGLFVGEGDFSFTYSLSHLMWVSREKDQEQPICEFLKETSLEECQKWNLIVSSYDPREALLTKYAECQQYLDKMESLSQITIQHNIDASILNTHFPPSHFHAIFWNHPHLGIEDAVSHQILLSHFFHTALQVLQPKGFIQVSLLYGQIPRWKVLQVAQKQGLKLTALLPFKTDAFDKYICKRNERGQSFKNSHVKKHYGCYFSEMESFLLRFEKTEEAFDNEKEFRKREERRGEEGEVRRGEEREKKRIIVSVGKESCAEKRKREKREGGEGEEDVEYECHFCGGVFSSLRGIRTHIRQLHELGKKGESGEIGEKGDERVMACLQCDKVFKNKEDLEQHHKAKHGIDQSITIQDARYTLTNSKANENLTQERREGEEKVERRHEGEKRDGETREERKVGHCDICDMPIPFGMSLTEHLHTLQPLILHEKSCVNCGKKFREERALRQHQNFCLSPA